MGMTELADEELSGVVPVVVQKQEDRYEGKVGYYTDERGYKRWGVIPESIPQPRINSELGERGPRSSDPRTWGME